MFVESILKKKGANVEAVDAEVTALEVARVFTGKKIGFVIVRDGGEIAGSVTERDIVNHLADKGDKALASPVRDFMTRNIVSCSVDDTLPKIMSLMTIKRTRHVLVLNGGEVKGVVSIGDVVKHRLEESMLDEESLRDYVSGMGYT